MIAAFGPILEIVSNDSPLADLKEFLNAVNLMVTTNSFSSVLPLVTNSSSSQAKY